MPSGWEPPRSQEVLIPEGKACTREGIPKMDPTACAPVQSELARKAPLEIGSTSDNQAPCQPHQLDQTESQLHRKAAAAFCEGGSNTSFPFFSCLTWPLSVEVAIPALCVRS